VGRSETALLGKIVGPFDGTVVRLTVGKSVGAFEGRKVGLDVVWEGTGLSRSLGASDGEGVGLKVGLSVTGAAVGASDGGLELSEGFALGCRLGDASVGSLLPVTVGPGESVGSALFVTVGPGESALLLGCEEAEGESDSRSPNHTTSRNSSLSIVSPFSSRVPPKTIVLFPPS
jgi:hypothetical protein